MPAKMDLVSTVELCHEQSAAPISSSSTVSISNPKVSIFGAKAGFVIPKNKLSGSLVPIFRGGSKVDTNSIVKEENAKQSQRKTNWGTDLTQDATVRKGRALAYQTRVEQITQQLMSGSLEYDEDQSSEPLKQLSRNNSASNHTYSKVALLELERRELIGEISRLNPSYKAPPDYIPILKESKVSIPIRTHPGYNFVCLLLGPESNTQKRLEEETGAKIRVYGTKSGTGERHEITKADISEALEECDDIYAHVSADTYEKIDTAVALIELLLTPIPGNTEITPKVVSPSAGNNKNTQTKIQESVEIPASTVYQAIPQPFQPYSSPWLTSNAPFLSSTFMHSISPSNSPQFPLLRASPGLLQYSTQRPNATVLRPQLLIRLPPNQSHMGPTSQTFTAGPVSTLRSSGPLNPQIGPPFRPILMPTISDWPLIPNPSSLNSTLRPLAVSTSSTYSEISQFNFSEHVARPSASNFSPHSTSFFSPRPIISSNFSSMIPQTAMALNPSMTSFTQRAQPTPAMSPFPGQLPRPILALSTSSSTIIPTFSSPTNSPIGTPTISTPKPPRPTSGDFTFQLLRTQFPSSPNSPASHTSAPQNTHQVPFVSPKAPSFRPALQRSPMMPQGFPSLNPAQQRAPTIPAGLPSFPGASLAPNILEARPDYSAKFLQVHQLPHLTRPMGSFTVPNQPIAFTVGNEQTVDENYLIYDPLSPTARTAPHQKGAELTNIKKAETDAEYEDLMTSVGVK